MPKPFTPPAVQRRYDAELEAWRAAPTSDGYDALVAKWTGKVNLESLIVEAQTHVAEWEAALEPAPATKKKRSR